MDKWKTVNSRLIFDNKWLKVRQEKVRLPDGTLLDDYYMWEEGEVVMIIPITRKEKYVLVKQYKHGAKEVMIEFPAGFVEDNESLEAAARRELLEETGYRAHQLIYLQYFLNNPTKVRGRLHLFLAPNLKSQGKKKFDIAEEIEVLEKSEDEVAKMIKTGQIKVTGTISAFSIFTELRKTQV